MNTLSEMLQEAGLEIPKGFIVPERYTPEQAFELIKGRIAVLQAEAEYIERKEAMGYDYFKKPEHYSWMDWCGQCNRSLKSWDDETCDCVDWDEE